MKVQSSKFKIQIFIGAIIILLVGYFGVRWWNRDVVSVKTAAVARGEIEEIVSAIGNINAPVYELDAKIGGKISSLKVKEGNLVKRGQILAELDNTSHLVSPANGIVAKINYTEGETIPPGFPAIVVANYSESWVDAQIDEIDIANVKIGDKVKITSDVYPDKAFEGVLSWITPVAELRRVGGRIKMDEESYVFPCKIKFLGDSKELKVNMTVNADIVTNKKNDTLIIPREALLSKDDSTYAFEIRKNRVFQKKIEIGLRSFSSVEAVSGAEEGEVLAISNLSKLKEKGRVKIER